MRITRSRFVIGHLGLVVSLPGYVTQGITRVVATVKPVILALLTLNHVDFDRFHFDSMALQPFDGRFNFAAPAFQYEANHADLIGHTGLPRSEEHTSELQSRLHLVCRLLLEKKKRGPTKATHLIPRETSTFTH